MTPTRGVLYIIWGESVERWVERSIASVKAIHPELPIEVVREPDKGPFLGLAAKARMLEKSPFDETLFLDADTVVLDRLDFGFAKAAQFGLACCINENPWASRYDSLRTRGDMVEYNSGVIFFTRKAQAVFDLWARIAPDLDSTLRFVRNGKGMKMPYADQCSFAVAVEEAGYSPFVLTLNWNFRAEFMESFFGPIKIFRAYMDPPQGIGELNARYRAGTQLIQQHNMRPAAS